MARYSIPDVTALPAPDLLARYDVAAPRYTSYPTADRFTDAYDAKAHHNTLRAPVLGRAPRALSLYVHVPFCASVCYYCACNKVVTRHHERALPYLDAVERELDLVLAALPDRPQALQLHLGGGTPTFLDDAGLARLVHRLEREFAFGANAERSIEVDPRTVDARRLGVLRDLGFNRISFGVQDVDPAVQQAVHRVQPAEQIVALVEEARAQGFGSINVDLIYGLPRQTPQSFAHTVQQVRDLAPDRIALYAYAHLPERFKPQRRIDAAELPGAAARVAMLDEAIQGFTGSGWAYIGMDHFARHDDALARAMRQGRLHRNFQGYTTLPECDLIALGPSAISRVGTAYAQNARTLEDYYAALAAGRLPVVRGLQMTADDLLRYAVIMAIMCQGEVSYAALEEDHLIDCRRYFAEELAALAPLAEDGLIEMNSDGFEVTRPGWFLVRVIAQVFDSYARAARAGQARFSRVL